MLWLRKDIKWYSNLEAAPGSPGSTRETGGQQHSIFSVLDIWTTASWKRDQTTNWSSFQWLGYLHLQI